MRYLVLLAVLCLPGCGFNQAEPQTITVVKEFSPPPIPSECRTSGYRSFPNIAPSQANAETRLRDLAKTMLRARWTHDINFLRSYRCECNLILLLGTKEEKAKTANLCRPSYIRSLENKLKSS